jgi:hypothetical protein
MERNIENSKEKINKDPSGNYRGIGKKGGIANPE